MEIDLIYLCRKIGDMAGIPVRLFDDFKQIFYYSLIPLPKDPFLLYTDRISSVKKEVGYFITPESDYYGILNSGSSHMVIGPARLTTPSVQDLKTLAFRLDIPYDRTDAFITGMKSFVHMPLDSILMILCSMNYVINGSKLELSDLEIADEELSAFTNERNDMLSRQVINAGTGPGAKEDAEEDLQKIWLVEEQLTDYVRRGDVNGIEEWLQTAPSIRPGVLSADLLRQTKDNLIMAGTLWSRAAIRSGVDMIDALSLCNSYIRKIERLTSMDQLTSLGYHMLHAFAEEVEKARYDRTDRTELVAQVNSYIHHHISENITTESLSNALYMSRSHLSTRFKQESGISLNTYISIVRISEAKHLLSHTDKSLLLISSYLGYSSQSHFCNVFKRITGITPSEYRKSCGNK